MKRMISAAFCLLVIFSVTAIVFAKGTTTRTTITGGGLQSPVEISDPQVLKDFNVWSGPGTFANDVEGTEGFIIDRASGVLRPPEWISHVRVEVLRQVRQPTVR
jgi:hypothetical protein